MTGGPVRRIVRSAYRPHSGPPRVLVWLVPEMKLTKRLDVARGAERWAAELPALIEQPLRG